MILVLPVLPTVGISQVIEALSNLREHASPWWDLFSSILAHLHSNGSIQWEADSIALLRSNVSLAAGALCQWVHAMKIYAEIYREVEPKRCEKKTEQEIND